MEEKINDIMLKIISKKAYQSKLAGDNLFECTKDSQARTKLNEYYPNTLLEPITEIIKKRYQQ